MSYQCVLWNERQKHKWVRIAWVESNCPLVSNYVNSLQQNCKTDKKKKKHTLIRNLKGKYNHIENEQNWVPRPRFL